MTLGPSTEEDVISLELFLEQGDRWPCDQTSKRSFDINFWWGIVRPHEKIRTKKDQKQGSVMEDPHVQHLFDVLCSTESDRDYEEVEISNPDDDRGSVVSSMMGSVASGNCDSPVLDDIGDGDNRDAYDNPDWENLNETEHESNIANTLKQLWNIRKKQ